LFHLRRAYHNTLATGVPLSPLHGVIDLFPNLNCFGLTDRRLSRQATFSLRRQEREEGSQLQQHKKRISCIRYVAETILHTLVFFIELGTHGRYVWLNQRVGEIQNEFSISVISRL
jgi:hypothetical protein